MDKKEILNITLSIIRNKFNRLKNDIIENIGLYVKFGDLTHHLNVLILNLSMKMIQLEIYYLKPY